MVRELAPFHWSAATPKKKISFKLGLRRLVFRNILILLYTEQELSIQFWVMRNWRHFGNQKFSTCLKDWESSVNKSLWDWRPLVAFTTGLTLQSKSECLLTQAWPPKWSKKLLKNTPSTCHQMVVFQLLELTPETSTTSAKLSMQFHTAKRFENDQNIIRRFINYYKNETQEASGRDSSYISRLMSYKL